MSFALVAITLGFLGSFHCIGMCGPIALALPVKDAGAAKKTWLIICYNLGRILTYSIFGLLAGLIGKAFVFAGLQQTLSVTIGLLLLVSVFLSAGKVHLNKLNSSVFGLFNAVKKSLADLFHQKGTASLFLIGLLNGLLPCGLVYMGIAGSVATGDPLKGALFMAAFGAGTLPVMLILPFAGSFITLAFRQKIRKAIPVFITVTAILLILRGLNLGIPYVSPKIDSVSENVSCHTEHTPSKKIIKCIGPASAHKK